MATQNSRTTEKAVEPKPAEPEAAVQPVVDDGVDRVAMVSRSKDGKPDQSSGYELIVPDEEKEAAENTAATEAR